MISSKDKHKEGKFVVKISNGAGLSGEIVVRDTRQIIMLEGKDYHRYQIVQPQGFEKEEIFHRPQRGYEALLSVVFTALAEASKRGKEMPK
jgi:hypothetical protein